MSMAYKQMEEYYNSPLWAKKRNERLIMDGFKCAKCGFTRALVVHHINYERFGNEDVSRDLITLCKKCHQEIEDQKKTTNPIQPSEHHVAYLAGKIRKNGWRTGICGLAMAEPKDFNKVYAINGNLSVSGPFFVACDHGCYHGSESHGVGLNGYGCCGADDHYFTEQEVVEICKAQIDRAEILFAYIDCNDCYGTLAEIGYAHAMNKDIKIVFSNHELEKEM